MQTQLRDFLLVLKEGGAYVELVLSQFGFYSGPYCLTMVFMQPYTEETKKKRIRHWSRGIIESWTKNEKSDWIVGVSNILVVCSRVVDFWEFIGNVASSGARWWHGHVWI